MGATPKTLLLGAALFAGAAYLHKHKLPEESFHAYCVDHELVEHNSYYATPATACARRKPTAGIYSLLPTGAPRQPCLCPCRTAIRLQSGCIVLACTRLSSSSEAKWGAEFSP